MVFVDVGALQIDWVLDNSMNLWDIHQVIHRYIKIISQFPSHLNQFRLNWKNSRAWRIRMSLMLFTTCWILVQTNWIFGVFCWFFFLSIFRLRKIFWDRVSYIRLLPKGMFVVLISNTDIRHLHKLEKIKNRGFM